MEIKQTRDKNGIIINNLTIKSMNNKDNKKNENNEKKNSKFNWKKFMEPIMISLLFALILLAGISFGMGNWPNGLCDILWAYVMYISIKTNRRADDISEKCIDIMKHDAYMYFKAKTADMKVKYFESRYGSFLEHILNKDNDKPNEKDDKDQPATPESSAAANEETEMGHIAEGVGSHD